MANSNRVPCPGKQIVIAVAMMPQLGTLLLLLWRRLKLRRLRRRQRWWRSRL